ncbi:hypothetical protein [Muricoccus radiodurans]|uniref:hypothetical protein n=1 Tax=Muricoccus radiodurans TaxID=2231721 RepID=UPI003CF54D4C
MKSAILGVMIAVGGALGGTPTAQAQPYGYGPGYGFAPPPAADWQRDEWQRRMEWRMHRREFWRQQRELSERRAYEAGQRDAWRQSSGWGYR